MESNANECNRMQTNAIECNRMRFECQTIHLKINIINEINSDLRANFLGIGGFGVLGNTDSSLTELPTFRKRS